MGWMDGGWYEDCVEELRIFLSQKGKRERKYMDFETRGKVPAFFFLRKRTVLPAGIQPIKDTQHLAKSNNLFFSQKLS